MASLPRDAPALWHGAQDVLGLLAGVRTLCRMLLVTLVGCSGAQGACEDSSCLAMYCRMFVGLRSAVDCTYRKVAGASVCSLLEPRVIRLHVHQICQQLASVAQPHRAGATGVTQVCMRAASCARQVLAQCVTAPLTLFGGCKRR